MTISQASTAQPLTTRLLNAAHNPLAGAIAVFLGGYLLLVSLTGRITMVMQNFTAQLVGRPQYDLTPGEDGLYVAQFVFALVVVVVGLFLSGGSLASRLAGSILVVVVAVATLVMLGLSISGAVPFPGREAGVVFRSIFVNPWFSVVLSIGIAWLLARRPRLGWSALAGTVLLAILPTATQAGALDYGPRTLLLLAVSAVVGAGIIAAGRPLRP